MIYKQITSIYISTRISVLCCTTVREKCPHSKFFRSIFSRIQTEYGEIDSLYSVRMWDNTDQKNSEYGHYSRSAKFDMFPERFYWESKWTEKFVKSGHYYLHEL